MNFEFATSQRIIFGPGCINQGSELIRGFGKNVVFITGGHNRNDNPIIKLVTKDPDLRSIQIICEKEPEIGVIQKSIEEVREFNPDVVVGIGGGSVVDTGKALAILATNNGTVRDYLEVVGNGLVLVNPSLPYIAIPTTSGTGSEVTRNAVIYDRESRVKASIRSPYMLPRVALVDPEQTLGLPPEISASTGMDALTQVIEPYLTRKANPITDSICLQAISIARNALLTTYQDPENLIAREQMSIVSLFGGLALANSGLGVVHGFAAAIGGMYPNARHGEICASILPAAFKVNRLACEGNPEYLATSQKINTISKLLSGNDRQPGEEILSDMNYRMHIPSLSVLGITRSDFQTITEKAFRSSSMKGNPIPLTSQDLLKILEMSF